MRTYLEGEIGTCVRISRTMKLSQKFLISDLGNAGNGARLGLLPATANDQNRSKLVTGALTSKNVGTVCF